MSTLEQATDLTTLLHQAGEPFAAGFMANPGEPLIVRVARGLGEYWAACALPPYEGTRLYPLPAREGPGALPLGEGDYALRFHYCMGLIYNADVLARKLAAAPGTRAALQQVQAEMQDYPGFGGWTHSILNFGRILEEGLDGYRERILAAQALPITALEPERRDLYAALLLTLEGIGGLLRRVREQLADPAASPEAETRRQRLLAAYARVPFQPARDWFEAAIATNFLYYLDGSDDLGRFDQFLRPYYEASRDAGAITPDEAREWIREQWEAMDRVGGWNVAIGGVHTDGTSAVSELTRLCVEAAQGRRRPNLALRIPTDLPEDVWEATFDSLAAGGGLPALYNEAAYRRAIREAHLNLTEADLADYAFGGCTELMVHGKSNVGSLEGDLNLPLVLVESLHRRLGECASFVDFLEALKLDFAADIRRQVEIWNRHQEIKARLHPHPLRSLLIDDCLESGREYNAGGARYNWCIVNVMGLANVADSLAAVKQVVFEEDLADREELLAALREDFAGHEALQARLRVCPHFGNDDPYVDDLAVEVSRFVFEELRRYAPWRGGRYLGSCLMFVTYAWFGEPVGATPDGRHAGMPIADSAGAYQGRDVSGPTALLKSVTKLPLYLAPGTLVINIRLAPKFFRGEGRRKLRDLILGYFALGGMQLQMTVVDQATLRAAMEKPEEHGDLIIRVGGYSEYWTRLDDTLRRSILERVEHE
jgi:formate C-acetyltransferase